MGQYLRGFNGCCSVLRDFTTEGLQRDGIGLGSAAHTGVESIDGREIVGGELEVEDVDVLGDAGGVVDLGITERPCCRCQRSITWAGVLPCVSAMAPITGS